MIHSVKYEKCNRVVNMKRERMRASTVPCRFWHRCGRRFGHDDCVSGVFRSTILPSLHAASGTTDLLVCLLILRNIGCSLLVGRTGGVCSLPPRRLLQTVSRVPCYSRDGHLHRRRRQWRCLWSRDGLGARRSGWLASTSRIERPESPRFDGG